MEPDSPELIIIAQYVDLLTACNRTHSGVHGTDALNDTAIRISQFAVVNRGELKAAFSMKDKFYYWS